MTPADVIRSVVAEYNTYTPDEIADKLAAEGMLWCGPVRSLNCPMHHLFEARMEAAGAEPWPIRVRTNWVTVGDSTQNKAVFYNSVGGESSINKFIRAYDRGEYDHLETGP